MNLAEGTTPGWRLFVPYPPEILWSAIFIVIFAVVFMKYVMPRMIAVLDERSERIEGSIKQAEEMKRRTDELKADQEAQIAQARREASEIREKARHDGIAIIASAKQKAEAEAERVLTTGRQQLQAEQIAAAAQLRTEVGGLASELAGKIVGESLRDEDRSRRVIDTFLDELEASTTKNR